MEGIVAFIKKNWIWLSIIAILLIVVCVRYKNTKKAELEALAAFDKLNNMAAKSKQGDEYKSEKVSLLKLVDNSTPKERALLHDLLTGSIAAFEGAEKEKDKEKAKKDFSGNISKMQQDILAKYGEKNVKTFKAKMDKYGFDI